MADPDDIVDEFRRDVPFEFFCQIIYAAGEHEVLPHDQSQFITGIIKGIIRIIASAPDTDAVKMRISRRFQ